MKKLFKSQWLWLNVNLLLIGLDLFLLLGGVVVFIFSHIKDHSYAVPLSTRILFYISAFFVDLITDAQLFPGGITALFLLCIIFLINLYLYKKNVVLCDGKMMAIITVLNVLIFLVIFTAFALTQVFWIG